MTARSVKTTLGDLWRSTRARVAGSAVVLVYHRIADLSSDPQRLAVSVERFGEQIHLLSETCNVMSAGEAIELIARQRRLPDRSVVVTIDDGYSDALLNAKPILSAHSVPATVFVSSDYMGGHTEFWWDELERVVLLSDALPSNLDIEASAARYRRDIASDADLGSERHPNAGLWDITMVPTSERQRVYLELLDFVRPLSPSDRASVLDSLRDQFGVEASLRPSHRPLTVGELRGLTDGGTVEIGAHTRSHQLLAQRTPNEQRDEIVGGKTELEQACGSLVRLFSYPYGDDGSYSEVSKRLVREAGFLGAFTTRFGLAFPWVDRFAVPRCPTDDISGGEFKQRLDHWFRMAR